MPIETIESNAKTKHLTEQWRQHKETEKKAQAARLAVEEELFGMIEDQIPNKGSVRVDGLKITTGYTDKWDQDALQAIRKKWRKSDPAFPFKEELKPINAEIKYIAEHNPDSYAKIETALSQEPKKPAFSLD